MPSQLQFNVKFLLLRARQLANVFTATVTDLNANIAYNMSINTLTFSVISPHGISRLQHVNQHAHLQCH